MHIVGEKVYWQELNDMTPIYTPLLLAENASIKFMQNQSLKIMDSSGAVYASLATGDYPLMVGGDTIAKAPFYVSKTGQLVSKNADIQGRITATTGIIGAFNIGTTEYSHALVAKQANGGGASTPNYDELLLSGSLIRFTSEEYKSAVYMGSDVAPVASLKLALMRVENNNRTGRDNVGIYLEVGPSNYGVGNALHIQKGTIVGFRMQPRRVSTNTTLTDLDNWVNVVATGLITLTLPYSPQDGQIYFIRKISTGNAKIAVGNGSHTIRKNYNASASNVLLEYGRLAILSWDKSGNYWTSNFCENF